MYRIARFRSATVRRDFQQEAAPRSRDDRLLALVPVMFTYSGWTRCLMAERSAIRGETSPARAHGTIAVIIVTVLTSAIYTRCLWATCRRQGASSTDRRTHTRCTRRDFLAVMRRRVPPENAGTFAGPALLCDGSHGVFQRVPGHHDSNAHVSIMAQAAWASC